jgi:predicted nucleic acid-binding protein
VIHLDTSALLAAVTADRPAAPSLRRFLDQGSLLGVSSLVLYEWWRGPRGATDLAYQELLFPRDAAFDFGTREADVAAGIYRRLGRRRGREMDIAIAACAIANDASLWTLNRKDFIDIPGLALTAPE